MSSSANPYPGLRPFDVADAPYFFGRRDSVDKLLRLVTQAGIRSKYALVGVVGETGSGKSSLVRAGLIPSLVRASKDWTSVTTRPGNAPIENICRALAASIAATLSEPDVLRLSDACRNDPATLRKLAETLNNGSQERRVLLVLDQLEELFVYPNNLTVRQIVLENILRACALPNPPLSVVTTIRVDFYGECAAHPGLAEALSSSQILVGPLTEDEILEAIIRPAELAGSGIESGLPELIIADLGYDRPSLSLLQFTLAELWYRSDGTMMTRQSYKALGGLGGALQRQAEALFESFSVPDKRAIQNILLRLVSADAQMTRRRASMNELAGLCGGQDNLLRLIGPFVARGLLTVSELEGDRIIEVTHEMLLRSWQRMRIWFDEERGFFTWLQTVRFKLEEWNAFQRDEAILLRGPALAQAVTMLRGHYPQMTQQEREFIEQSERVARNSALNFSKLIGSVGLKGLEAKVARRIAEYERVGTEYQTLSDQLDHRKKDMERLQLELNSSSPTIFISYAREDAVRAQRLYEDLKEKGFRPWLDSKNLLPGQAWKREITQNIKRADFVLVCLSRVAVEKRGFFQSEVKLVIETAQEIPSGQVFLIPVRFDDCTVPPELSDRQYVDLFADDGSARIYAALVTKWKTTLQ